MATTVSVSVEAADKPHVNVNKGMGDGGFAVLYLGSAAIFLPGRDAVCADYARELARVLDDAAEALDQQRIAANRLPEPEGVL